jgi:cell division protein YceG involved in septum cleavage
MPEAGNGQSSASEIIFTVKSGMSSRKVAVLLEEVGLIDDAEGFNSYIENSGRASIIRVGTYKMPKGSTYDEIITEITTKH